MDFDVVLAELGTEALQQLDLLVGELQLPFPGVCGTITDPM